MAQFGYNIMVSKLYESVPSSSANHIEQLAKKAQELQQAGQSHKATMLMGQYYARRQEYPKALQCYEKAQHWEAMADLYLKMGQTDQYHFYFAKYLLQENMPREAANSFLEARAFSQAAQIFETLFDYKKAIEGYMKAGQIDEAAHLLIRIGQTDKAARLYEKAGKLDQAVQYYKQTKSWDNLIRVYDRKNEPLQALRVALHTHDESKARHYFSKIPATDSDFLQAHIYMLVHWVEQNQTEKIPSMFYAIMYNKEAKLDEDKLLMLGELLEKAGFAHEALQSYQRAQKMGHHRPHIQEKIKAVEQKLSFIKKRDSLKSYENRFELYQFIGRGAMSKVFKAKDLLHDRWVALKTLSKDQEEDEQLQAFFQEARTMSNLSHPNIVQIYDYGIENDHFFIAMEYLTGKTLQYMLEQVERLSLQDFLNIISQLCRALMYAHEMNVVHRDIKPGNVMLLSDQKVKLMDFGIAKRAQQSNQISIARGTPKYVSPEQILGIQTTTQSDIYSLGVMMYQMLTGVLPFEGEDILHDHIHTNPTPLDQHVKDIPYHLVNLIMTCLAKKPERRPADVQKILEVIETLNFGHTKW
jgi:tRNA A-37 threonylcarbamoyl transferase component Bud32